MMGSEWGDSLLGGQRLKLWKGDGHGEIFGDDEISVSKFRFHSQILGGDFAPYEPKPPPKWQLHASCGGQNCHRFLQALPHMATLCHVPTMCSCSQFCLTLDPHRFAVPFPPTFALPWQNSIVQILGEQRCSRQNLGQPIKNDPKTTKIWE